jgi:hypothetical protein
VIHWSRSQVRQSPSAYGAVQIRPIGTHGFPGGRSGYEKYSASTATATASISHERCRSARSASATTTTAIQTQWCDHETGETSRPVMAVAVTATSRSPRRYAQAARASPAAATPIAMGSQTVRRAGPVSPSTRLSAPYSDWLAR